MAEANDAKILAGLDQSQDADYYRHRQLSRNDLQWFHQIERQTTVTASTYAVTRNDDFILVGATCTVTLPLAARGREIEVVKTFAGGYVNIVPTSTDTLVGTTLVQILVQWTALRFKAISGGWILI